MTNVTVAYNTSSGTVSGSAVSVGGSSTLYIMNCLLADNTYSSGLSDGDFYHNTGTVNDNGSNIVENSSGFSFTQPGDIIGNQPSLNLVSILASNNTINNSLTLEILPGSIAINAGSIGSNGGILVPAEDQRGGSQFGMIDIGAFEFGAGGPVPVVLIDFRAQAEPGQNSVLLTWSTAQEVNNSHFNVQRSIEGENWENIGQVSGNGTISSLSSYIFTDADARPIAYYRLEQVDYNGISEYSPIVRVDFMGIVPIEIIGSNPVYSELDVLINAEYSVNTIEIYDMYGVMVYSEKLEGALSTISLDVSELAVGTYFITLNNEENARIRFVKS
jgi:hypothetical protein